jgi:hypothetical protein
MNTFFVKEINYEYNHNIDEEELKEHNKVDSKI